MKPRDAHLIMVNYYYPPMKSPGVTRNYHFSKSFSKYFSKVSVYTTSNRNILSKDTFTTINNINIHEVKTYDYRTVTSTKTNTNSIHFDDKKKQSLLAKIGIKLIDTFPFNIILGEGGLIYTWNAISNINKQIKIDRDAVIYTSFRPYSDLFIGYILKKRNPQIKWIADFRDLHVEPIYKNVFLPKLQIWWNRRMLRKADIVTSVSQGLIHQLQKYNRPSLAFLNGVTIRPKEDYYKKFTISYTGSLFKNERDPSLLFASIENLLDNNSIDSNNFQIVYAGKDGHRFEQMINDYKLESIFVNHNMVSRKEALLIQSKSHLNLLLSVNSEEHKGVLTGKLFEYLGALNKIILIMIGDYDEEFEKLFDSCDAGTIFYTKTNTNKDIQSFIINAYNNWTTQSIAPLKMNKINVENHFSWDKSVEKLINRIYS